MTEQLKALREATRINMPDPADRTQRIVGFKLPEEMAWPKDGSAHDILCILFEAIDTRPSPEADALPVPRKAIFDALISVGPIRPSSGSYEWKRAQKQTDAVLAALANTPAQEGE